MSARRPAQELPRQRRLPRGCVSRGDAAAAHSGACFARGAALLRLRPGPRAAGGRAELRGGCSRRAFRRVTHRLPPKLTSSGMVPETLTAWSSPKESPEANL